MAIIVDWGAGSPAGAGGTVEGSVSFVTAESGFDWAIIPNSPTNEAHRIRWGVASQAAYVVRYYLGVPRTMDPAAPTDIFRASVSGSPQVQHAFPPDSEQGSLRFKASGNTVVDTLPVGTLARGDVIRVETEVDTIAETVRYALFRLGADVPFYDTGDIADAAQVAVTQHSFGHHANTPSGGPWAISRVRVDDVAGAWIGRHASDVRAAVPASIIGTT